MRSMGVGTSGQRLGLG